MTQIKNKRASVSPSDDVSDDDDAGRFEACY